MSRLPIGKKQKPASADPDRDEDDDDDELSSVETIDLTSVSEDDEDSTPVKRGKWSMGRIIGMVAGALAIVALIAGGFILVTYLSSEKSPIPGVTAELHAKGIELIESHTQDYRTVRATALSKEYIAGGTGEETAAQFKADQEEIKALIPERPADNDQRFIDTLLAIQGQIENAISVDATELYLRASDGYSGESMSTNEWRDALNSIERLKNAKEMQELEGIYNSAQTQPEVTDTPEPVVEASPTPAVYMTLKQGDKNSSAVKKLQRRLFALGYLAGTADGDFGSATQSAVKLFQEAAGLNVDGIATPEVQERLFAEDAPARSLTDPLPTSTDQEGTGGDTGATGDNGDANTPTE